MSLPPTLAERLSQIIEPLRRAVAAHGGTHRADVPLVVLLWSYLHRVAQRFASLTARLEKGPLAAASRPRADRPAPIPRLRLPRRFGFLAKFGWNFRNYSSQLRHLLEDPEMKELLATSPQAARILRPLCRMLGIEPAPDLPPALFPRRTAPASPAAPDTERAGADPAAPTGSPWLSPASG